MLWDLTERKALCTKCNEVSSYSLNVAADSFVVQGNKTHGTKYTESLEIHQNGSAFSILNVGFPCH